MTVHTRYGPHSENYYSQNRLQKAAISPRGSGAARPVDTPVALAYTAADATGPGERGMKRRSAFRLLAFTILLLALAAPTRLWADKHIVEEVTLQAPPGEEGGRTALVETWLGEDRFARIDRLNNITTLIRRDMGKMFLVQHDLETVIEVELPFTLPEHLRDLFSEIQMSWRLNRLTETRVIGSWNCQRVTLQGRGAVSVDVEMWVTPETEVDTAAFRNLIGEAVASSPLYRDMAQQLADLGTAFSIRTVTTVSQMGLSATTVAEVASIADEPAPRGTYDPPDDYQLRTLDFGTYLSLVRRQHPPTP